jgi:hypothetical protein
MVEELSRIAEDVGDIELALALRRVLEPDDR